MHLFFLEAGVDVYNNWYQGQPAEYILASGAYTLGTGLAITWGSAKTGAYIGKLVSGSAGFIVGGITGLLIGIALDILSDKIKELIF